MHSGGRLLLGAAVCMTVVVESSKPTPYSQDLSWRVIWFVWKLGLTRLEKSRLSAFYLGVSLTWAIECYPRGDNKIKCGLFY